MEKKQVRAVLVSAINDSHSRDPKGVDQFVEELAQAIGPEGLVNSYKLAWTKLTELFVILDKAECHVLKCNDILNIMTYLLTSSVCIKDSATAQA